GAERGVVERRLYILGAANTTLFIAPAQQGLEAGNARGRQRDLRLEVGHDAIVPQGGKRRRVHRLAVLDFGVHRGFEQLELPAPGILGRVERDVSRLHDLRTAGAVPPQPAGADARPASEQAALILERLAEASVEPVAR